MTQGERVRIIRKELNLTLEKFGERLGVKKNAISQIETGRNSLTEQNIKAICREFNVDYIWLTTGEGEMFMQTDDSAMDLIDRIMFGEDEFHKNLLKLLAQLDKQDLFTLKKILDKYSEMTKETIDDIMNDGELQN